MTVRGTRGKRLHCENESPIVAANSELRDFIRVNRGDRLYESDGYSMKWTMPERYHPYVKVRGALTIKVDERRRAQRLGEAPN